MRRTTFHVLMLALLGACNGTRTGNPDPGGSNNMSGGTGSTTDNGEGAYGNCDAKPSDLTSLDKQTRLGFSAADVLAFAGGVHQTKIRWQADGFATFAPESGEHGLRVEVTQAKGNARFVDYTEHKSSGDNSGPTLDIGSAYPDCASQAAIEIDVDVAIKSDGGALDEKAKGTLRATKASFATLTLNIDDKDIGGALELRASKPAGFTLDGISIDLTLSSLGVRGSLQTTLTMKSAGSDTNAGTGTSGAAGRGGAAIIGDSPLCDEDGGFAVKLDQKLQKFDAQDAIDRVNALKGVALAWQGGAHAQATFAFAHDGGAVCAVLDPNPFTGEGDSAFLRVHGTLHVTSDDQRIDADWPVTLEAHTADDGTLGETDVALQAPNLVDAMTTDVEADYGISGIDASGYDAAQVSFMLQLAAGSAASTTGMLTINGIKHAMCPPPPKDPSMGTPGCAGDDITVLDSATLGD